MSHRTSCKLEMWAPSFDVSRLSDDIVNFYTIGGVLLEDTSEGQSIKQSLERLQGESRALQLVKDFMGSWEDTLWFLRMMSRAIVGEARFCEFMWLFGVGQSGKDMILLLYTTFFGDGETNYAVTLNGDFLVKTGFSAKEAASPFLAGVKGKRRAIASEVPKHEALQTDLIKKYCEQMGVKLTARKLYRAATSFRPIGLLVATSNFPPTLTASDRDDDGLIRRARVWQTTGKFVRNPSNDMEKKADLTLGPRIMGGEFNGQVLFLANLFYRSLGMEACPDITVTPKPASMSDASEELARGGLKTMLPDYLTIAFAVSRKDAMPIRVP